MNQDVNKRESLVSILIMHEWRFHFLSVVADRLQDGPAACPQLWNESGSCIIKMLTRYSLIYYVYGYYVGGGIVFDLDSKWMRT